MTTPVLTGCSVRRIGPPDGRRLGISTSSAGVGDLVSGSRYQEAGMDEALRVWYEAGGEADEVVRVDTLKRNSRTHVYRLVCRTGRGSVIAKRCREQVAKLERVMYEQIVGPAVGLRSPRLLGFSAHPERGGADDQGHYWVFLEDLGPRRHDPSDAGQRHQLAGWLGVLASCTTGLAQSTREGMPRRGLADFRPFLDTAIPGLSQLGRSRAFPARVRALLEDVSRSLAIVDAKWAGLQALAASVPEVVVHGDCQPKNIHVVDEPEPAVIPIDWGGAGIGLPASDLGVSSVSFAAGCEFAPDAQTYADAIRPVWPEADARAIERLVDLGRILYGVKLFAQSLPVFEHHSMRKVEVHLELYAGMLGRSVGRLDV